MRMRKWHWVIALLVAAVGSGPFGVPAPAAAAALALTAQARQAIVQVLRDSDEYPDALPASLDDGALKAAALRYARTVTGQRLRPRAVDSDWAMVPPTRALEAEFETHLAIGDLGAWLQSLSPKAEQYRALAGWRCRYAQLVDNGGWSALPPGPSLSHGATGPGVLALRVRLAVEGYTTTAVAAVDLFDPTLEQALKQFQLRHDLAADGVVGRATRDALNVPAEKRLMQIDANLERWRWAPALPGDRIEVDAAGDEAILYRAGETRLRMRVITGDAKHRTPMFVSRVDGVLLNPPWNVPASIAGQELWPKEALHPGYLAANQIRLVDGHLQQAPGAMNALGALKFDMPDPFAIYLHDTPAKAAFGRPDRHLSHGCIRLEMPRELAVALLGQQGWSREKLDAAILGGATQRIPLTQAMPVFVFYWTAAVDQAGALNFRRDPYRWDDKLMQALAAAKMP
jgi:murein L,D-transpeptidase YcbB/YkuD